jgi:HK97 family phage portal protein
MTVYYVSWWNPKTWNRLGKGAEERNAPLPQSTGAGNPRGTNYSTQVVFPGTHRNYTARAGKLYNSSIVAAALGWMGSNAPQAPLVAFRTIEGADKPRRTPHAIDALLAKPNKYYSYAVLIASTLLSLVVSGNAYWYIVRDNAGAPKELWWCDHTRTEPSWPANATSDNWVTHYTFRTPNGQYADLPFEDVIHFREGALDPDNSRKSLSRLATALRRIALMHDIENYEAALLANMGVAGLVFMPKDTNGANVSPDELAEIRDTLDDRISGDNRGMSVGLMAPMDVMEIGKSPEEMLLDTASDAPEATICSLIGISPITLNLKVGLKEATYDNKRIANTESWQNGIVPRLKLIAAECTVQLVPLFTDAPSGLVIRPDFSDVEALQPDRVQLYKALKEATGGPFLMIEEARDIASLDALSPEALARLEELRDKSKPATTPPTGDNNNA